MPTYKYKGSQDFFNSSYGIEVKPNQVVMTPYVLPDNWSDFELIDINTPPPLIPHVEDIVVTTDTNSYVDTTGYGKIVVKLVNPDQAALQIFTTTTSAPEITLDSVTSTWATTNDGFHINRLILKAVGGSAQVRIYLGYSGEEYGEGSITTQSSGGTVTTDGAHIKLGIPSDGTYQDGLLDLDPNGTIADAVDEINEILSAIAPPPPKPLQGSLQYQTVVKSGYVANYSNLGHITAGSEYSLIVNSDNFTALTPNTDRFSKADKGTLVLYKNDTQVDSFDLAAHFNANEKSGCQSYPPATSTNGYITVLQVCWYNNFAAYQKGQASVNFKPTLLDVGYNKIQLAHVLSNATDSTNPSVIYYDDAGRPTVTDAQIQLGTPQYKYLSGIKYFTMNTTWSVSISASGIFDKTYVAQPVKISGSGLNDINIAWNDTHASGFANPPNYNDPWNYSSTFSFDKEDAGQSITFTVTPSDPFGSGTAKQVSLSDYLFNTYPNKSTDKHEYFVDEQYRLPDGSYDTVPTSITNQWDSTAALTNGNAQVYVDKLVYPHINFNLATYKPDQDTGRDYSTFTGDQVYLRAIKDDGTPHTNGTLNITGITWDNITNGDIQLFMKIPSATGWLDLTADYNAATFHGNDGDGCVTGHAQNGDTLQISWSSGYDSTASGGYMYILKIVLKNTNVEIQELWDFE